MKMSKIVMTSKGIACVSAAVLAVVFASPAAAQAVIGGVEISASDLPKVQDQCDRLTSGPATSLSTDSSNDSSGGISGDASTGGSAGSGGTSTGDAGAGIADRGGNGDRSTEVGTLSGGRTAINLASITAEDCMAAGLSPPEAIPNVITTN